MRTGHFFLAFIVTYLLSFDAVVKNPVAGGIAYGGSIIGIFITSVKISNEHNKRTNNIK